MTIEFKYELKAQVRLIELDRPGIVASMSFDGLGTQYRIDYWHDGSRKTTWVWESEIEAKND